MKLHRGSILIISLIILSGILMFVFISRDNLIKQEKLSLLYYQKYLENRFNLVDLLSIDKLDELCKIQQTEKGKVELDRLNYYFSCHSLFLNMKEVRKKYIQIENIKKLIHLEMAKDNIYVISSLADLPESGLSNPQIVILKNAINEQLDKDFYGIIITDYPLSITGRKIYGTVYSSYKNGDRNLTYKKEVIENLQNRYWHYQPHSRNLLGDD